MNRLTRFSNWWLTQYRGQGCLGRIILSAFTTGILLSSCFICFVSLSIVTTPFRPEPTAESQVVSLAVGEDTATAESSGSVATAITDTIQPIATAEDPATTFPNPTQEESARQATSPAIRAATAVVLTVEAAPTSTRPPTRIPPTATNPPLPTATQRILPTSLPPTAIPPTAVPPTAVPPTAVPPTAIPATAVLPTAIPPTSVPPTPVPATDVPPQPTAPLPVGNGVLEIIGVNKSAEYVDIRNNDVGPVDLAGWTLRSERGSQDCSLGGVIQPGEVLRIWAMAESAGQGGFNCGFGSNIWNNNESDPAVLINPSGQEVSRK